MYETCIFVRVWKLFACIEERTQTDGERIFKYKVRSIRSLDETTKLEAS